MEQIHIGWQLVSNSLSLSLSLYIYIYIYISAVNRYFIFFTDYSHIFLNFIAINPT